MEWILFAVLAVAAGPVTIVPGGAIEGPDAVLAGTPSGEAQPWAPGFVAGTYYPSTGRAQLTRHHEYRFGCGSAGRLCWGREPGPAQYDYRREFDYPWFRPSRSPAMDMGQPAIGWRSHGWNGSSTAPMFAPGAASPYPGGGHPGWGHPGWGRNSWDEGEAAAPDRRFPRDRELPPGTPVDDPRQQRSLDGAWRSNQGEADPAGDWPSPTFPQSRSRLRVVR